MSLSRRPLLALVVLSWCLALPSIAQQTSFPAPWPKPLTPEAYWHTLMIGNETYVGGALPYTGLAEQRTATKDGQNPPVTVLACSDSRVPPELVFGRAIGDLFVVRAAGNVADTFGIASIEYGIAKHWTKVIVVLGHEDCGAVVEALKTTKPGTPSLIALVNRIRRSFIGVDIKEPGRVRKAVIANANASANYLIAHSEVIRDAVRKKDVTIIVAYYELEKGEVTKIR